jgi:hypothetical protein
MVIVVPAFAAGTLSVCTFLLSRVTAAGARDLGRDVHQLAHRPWGEKDGYPGSAQAVAQTADGFVWIGSDIGAVSIRRRSL